MTMTRQEIFTKIQSTLVEHFEVPSEEVTEEAHLIEDLDLDSIDAIDMAVHLEQLTGSIVAEDELRSMHTVGDIVTLVETMGQRSA